MKHKADLIFANIFYLIAFSLDAAITTTGTSSSFGAEGNPIVIWLWSIFGYDNFILKVIYVIIIFAMSIIFYNKNIKFLGLLVPFSFGIGHVLGFSTWIFAYNNEFNSNLIREFHRFLVPYGIFFVSPIAGGIMTKVVRKIWRS